MIFGSRFLWKIDIEDNKLIWAREKTFLEITYLVLTIISTLFAPVLVAGVLSQLFVTGLVWGTVMAIMVYLVMILVLWIIYFFVFSKRAKEAIKDIIQHYYF
nr:hypothetical protein [uncultured Blautia sp.]